MDYDPPSNIVHRLGKITELLAKAMRLPDNFISAPKAALKLPGGELYIDSNLELDTDGWAGVGGKLDETHRSETSLRYSDGSPINANTVPYFVLPKPTARLNALGIQLGDYAAVLYDKFMSFAVFADVGCANKIGEGSIELLRRLGQERITPDGSVRDVGIEPPVVTVIFPGSGKGKGGFATEAELLTSIEAEGRKCFLNLGGHLID